ncbi:NAD(P)H-dependent oxidoreductase [Candidatus Poribacteria bacterium]
MIYQHLFDRVKEPEIVRAGIIGCGNFATTIVTQAPLIPRFEIPIVADIDLEAGRSALRQAGIADDDIAICDSRASALTSMEAGRSVVVQDAMLMMDLPLDVIATATRVPEVGARYAYEAIQHGKHVVMVDKEADSVVGPILKHLADKAGVVFTTDDGDQPGLLMGLVSWARSLGLEVLCGGNMRDCLYDPAEGTVSGVEVSEEDKWALERIPAGQAERYTETRSCLFANLRSSEWQGDPMSHVVVAANGTGLLPDVSAGHIPVVRFLELPEVLCPVEDGGILRTRGVVDVPIILRTADGADSGGGVYVVVANKDEHSRRVMINKGLIANSRNSAMLIYRPYHLCGAETAMSILCAGLLGVPTGSSEILPRVDMVAEAARDFKAGEVLEDLGYNRDLRASMIPSVPVADDNPLPFFMLENNRLSRDISAGTVITRSMITPPQDSALWSLRKQQDEHFNL